MEITQHPGGDSLELRLSGRIDATWGGHLGTTIENAVRAGSHRIVLNFAQVQYISSLGISVLFQQFKLLKSVNGSLTITNPNKMCQTVLTTVGLTGILATDVAEAPATLAPPSQEKLKRGGATYDIYPQKAVEPLSCALIGQPDLLGTSGFSQSECRSLTFANGSFGLGLGAFGENFADCQGRFGEFLAAGGCAITLPTNDPQALPDYVVEQGELVPQIEALYALAGSGDFPHMVRFDALSDVHGKIALSELIDTLIHISAAGANRVCSPCRSRGIGGRVLAKISRRPAHCSPSARSARLACLHHRAHQREESVPAGWGCGAQHANRSSAVSASPHGGVFQCRFAGIGAYSRGCLSVSARAARGVAFQENCGRGADSLGAQRRPAFDGRHAPLRGRGRNRSCTRCLLDGPVAHNRTRMRLS